MLLRGQDASLSAFRWFSDLNIPVIPFPEGLRAKWNTTLLLKFLQFPAASGIQISQCGSGQAAVWVQTCYLQGTVQLCITVTARLASDKMQYLS